MRPFIHIPRQMTIEFIHFIIPWINTFLENSGISTKLLPHEVILIWKMNYKNHCCLINRSYYEVRNKPSPSNIIVPRLHRVIALGPTGNYKMDHLC